MRFSRLAAAALLIASVVSARAEMRPMPIFDTHIHYSDNSWAAVPVAEAFRLLDAAGIRVALVSSTPGDAALRLYAAQPTRVIPELRPYRTRADMHTWHGIPEVAVWVEQQLATGPWKGIGEFHVSGDAARSDTVKRIVDMAVARDITVHAHSDVTAINHLFAHNPRVRILWAHLGFTDAKTVDAMMTRYPNLYVETAIRSDFATGTSLQESWRALFLKYQDRVMVGTDTYILPRWQSIVETTTETRAWLRSLPPDVAEKLAWRNAARLYKVDETAFK